MIIIKFLSIFLFADLAEIGIASLFLSWVSFRAYALKEVFGATAVVFILNMLF
jgi:hypothetical protein